MGWSNWKPIDCFAASLVGNTKQTFPGTGMMLITYPGTRILFGEQYQLFEDAT